MAQTFKSNETEAYNAARAAWLEEVAAIKVARKTARPARAKRTAQPLYGDMALMAAFNGIATDGSGRSNVQATRVATQK